jgi:hypothetical protein
LYVQGVTRRQSQHIALLLCFSSLLQTRTHQDKAARTSCSFDCVTLHGRGHHDISSTGFSRQHLMHDVPAACACIHMQRGALQPNFGIPGEFFFTHTKNSDSSMNSNLTLLLIIVFHRQNIIRPLGALVCFTCWQRVFAIFQQQP